jgi:enoyl-CoA hydratase/carnithine racemase
MTERLSAWHLEQNDRVAVLSYLHPPRNLMTFADMTELEVLVQKVAADDSVTLLVIASDLPDYFVAHGDLDDLLRLGRGEPFAGDAGSWPRTLALFEDMPQVVIAAINGQAWGGGLELTLACTLRVAGPNAHLALCEVGLGLIPGGGGTQRLPRIIGPGRAAEMILTTRAVRAEEALHIGLVQAVLPDAPFLDAVLDWVAPIAARPPDALRAAKRALLGAAALPLAEGLALEGSLVGPLLANPDAIASQQAAITRYASTPPHEIVSF